MRKSDLLLSSMNSWIEENNPTNEELDMEMNRRHLIGQKLLLFCIVAITVIISLLPCKN